MTPAERIAAARSLLDNALWGEIIDRLEASAIDDCIYAPTDIARLEHAARAREIRSLRDRIRDILSEASEPDRQAPA